MLNKLKPYLQLMRLHRPVGIFLLLWPTLWALWIAAQGVPSWSILLIFILGTVIMRSAGCIINDYADRHFDGHVERTKQRPLVTGKADKRIALWLFVVLCVMALGLVLLLNRLSVELAVAALILTCFYPFSKRFFVMPQVVLGLVFAFGIPMAFAAIQEQIPWLAWLLFLATFFWIVAYDTQYALSDREEDLKVGIQSSAIFLGRFAQLAVVVNQGLLLLCLVLIGLRLHLPWCYYVSLVIAVGFFIYQYKLTATHSRVAYLQAFLNNVWPGFVIFVGLVVSFLK